MRNKLNEKNKSFVVKKDDLAAVQGYTDPKTAQRDHRVRLVKAGLGIVVVIVLIGASIYGIMQIRPTESNKKKEQRVEFEQAISTKQTISSLNKEANKGDVDGSINQYNTSINNETDKTSKSILQLNKSVAFFNAQPQRLDEAIATAVEAYTTDQTYATTKWLATVYDAKNDRPNAVKFYKLAVDLVPDNAGTAVNKQQLQEKLKELGT